MDGIKLNPHLRNIESSPYELGRLLYKLPADFSSMHQQTKDVIQIAEAAVSHAENADLALTKGLQAIGDLLAVAADSKDHGMLDRYSVRDLGYLIKHLAVELEFVWETGRELDFIVTEHEKLHGEALQ